MGSVLIRVGYNHMDIFFLHTDRHGLTRILLRASLQLVGKEEIIRERRVGNIKFL